MTIELDQLPIDILNYIFEFTKISDIANIANTNKSLYKIITTDKKLFHNKIIKNFEITEELLSEFAELISQISTKINYMVLYSKLKEANSHRIIINNL